VAGKVNCRSGVTLAMRHTHSTVVKGTYMISGLGKGDEHPAILRSCNGVSTMASLFFTFAFIA